MEGTRGNISGAWRIQASPRNRVNFVNTDLIRILDCALGFNPCLVLTDGTDAFISRMATVDALREQPYALILRVSIEEF